MSACSVSVANVMLVVVSMMWLLRMTFYCCVRSCTPVMGIRLRSIGGAFIVDYNRGGRLAMPFIFASITLLLKLIALGVDRWTEFDVSFTNDSSNNFTW